ncbi:MAG: hypothetical protein IPJ30_09810 [Acidobacteria bacterium]|nr:hypothetical protein [Acidobacteriota bacterium]
MSNNIVRESAREFSWVAGDGTYAANVLVDTKGGYQSMNDFRMALVRLIRSKLRAEVWPKFWILIPLLSVVQLPIGLLLFQALAFLGIAEAPRWTQLHILISVAYGLASGIFALGTVDFAELSESHTSIVKWLARAGMVFPILLILTLFAIFASP